MLYDRPVLRERKREKKRMKINFLFNKKKLQYFVLSRKNLQLFVLKLGWEGKEGEKLMKPFKTAMRDVVEEDFFLIN